MYDCYHYVVNKDEYINNLAAVNTTTDRQTDRQTDKQTNKKRRHIHVLI